MPSLGREPGTQVFRELDEHPDDERVPGRGRDPARRRAVLRHRGRPRGPGPRGHPVDAGPDRRSCSTAAGSTSSTPRASAKMADIVDLADESGVTLRLARLKPAVRATLERDGVLERLGADQIHGNVYRAVQAELASAAQGARRHGALMSALREAEEACRPTPLRARTTPLDERGALVLLRQLSHGFEAHGARRHTLDRADHGGPPFPDNGLRPGRSLSPRGDVRPHPSRVRQDPSPWVGEFAMETRRRLGDRDVQVGGSVYCRRSTHGDGVPLVHIHGFAISGAYLMPTARALAARGVNVVPDLPGYGRSERRDQRPGHPRPGRDDAGDPRPPRHRQGRPGRELDGLRDQPGGGSRGARAGPPPRPGLPGWRRAQPAPGPRPRPAGEGRASGEPEDVPRRATGLREVRAAQRPAPVPRADALPVAGAPAAHPRPDPCRPGGPRPTHAVTGLASAKSPGSLRST